MNKRFLTAALIIGISGAAIGIYIGNKQNSPVPATNGVVQHLTALSLNDSQGKLQKLSQWQGKYLVVNFWAIWWAPCVQELPALADLQTKLSIQSLGDLTKEEFEQHKHLIKNDINQKRAKHAVYENQRTIEAAKKLELGDLDAFGQLMNESHISLQFDYEVTGVELDTIVSAAWNQPGVIGARMTGAGFGGCAIAIVESGHIDNFKNNLDKIYTKKIGISPSFYVATISDGAKEITEECAK